MKNLLIIAVLILASLTVTATSKVTDYVITKEGTVYFKSVKFGADTGFLTCLTQNGITIKIKRADIMGFRREGAVFEKKPVIINNQVCENCDFMEILSIKNNMKVCKYMVKEANGDYTAKLFVFKNNEYITTITKQMLEKFIKFA